MDDFGGNVGTGHQNPVGIPGDFDNLIFRFGLSHYQLRLNLGQNFLLYLNVCKSVIGDDDL
jgi:hypothetical protein